MVVAQSYSALVDSPTKALLTLTFRVPIISFLAKSEPDTEHVYLVNSPHYLTEFPIADANYLTFPEWKWERKERVFAPLPKKLLTEALRKKSLLAVKKSMVLAQVMKSLSLARNPVLSALPMQETVYLTKKNEAQRYKDAGYPEDNLIDFPYVLQYSDFSGLPMKAAADEILLKARFDDDVLLKTEYFRLRYFNYLKNVTEIALVDKIYIDFREEFYKVVT